MTILIKYSNFILIYFYFFLPLLCYYCNIHYIYICHKSNHTALYLLLYAIIFKRNSERKESNAYLCNLLCLLMYLSFPVLFISFCEFKLLSGIIFFSTWKSSFSISYGAVLNATTCFSILVYLWMILFCLHFLKDSFAGCIG